MEYETVIRQRATAVVDPYSGQETAKDWTVTDDRPFDAIVWDSKTTDPLIAGREPVDSDFTCSLPYGADVQPADRVVVRGQVCEVEGRPFDHRCPFTGVEEGRIVYASVREG